MGLYLSALSSLVRPKETERITMAEFPNIQSKHSLVAKHVTKEKWDKLSGIVTKTSGFTYVSDMDVEKIRGNVADDVPVHSVRIRVGRSIQGFGLSPGITKEQRVGVEKLMSGAFAKFSGDLAGNYYPLTGMDEGVRQQLVDDHFLFMSGDPNLKVAGMERDWPEGRGIFHNEAKTFLVWVNEEDQLRIISMQKGGDVKGVFERLARGIKTVQD